MVLSQPSVRLARLRRGVVVACEVALLALLGVAFFFRLPQVSGLSMEPRIGAGEFVLIDTLTYRFGPVRRGDIVAFRHGGSEAYLKRVIALPGERVAIVHGFVLDRWAAAGRELRPLPRRSQPAGRDRPRGCILRVGRQPEQFGRLARLGLRPGLGDHWESVAGPVASEQGGHAMIDRETVIQWYPGHMAAAMREMERRSSLIDIFIEVIDARIAIAGANSDLSQVVGRKPRLIVLTRDDLADPAITKAWLEYYPTQTLPRRFGQRARTKQLHASIVRLDADAQLGARQRRCAHDGHRNSEFRKVARHQRTAAPRSCTRRRQSRRDARAAVVPRRTERRDDGHARHSRSEDRVDAGTVDACDVRSDSAR